MSSPLPFHTAKEAEHPAGVHQNMHQRARVSFFPNLYERNSRPWNCQIELVCDVATTYSESVLHTICKAQSRHGHNLDGWPHGWPAWFYCRRSLYGHFRGFVPGHPNFDAYWHYQHHPTGVALTLSSAPSCLPIALSRPWPSSFHFLPWLRAGVYVAPRLRYRYQKFLDSNSPEAVGAFCNSWLGTPPATTVVEYTPTV
jgi:hypothetical protein